MSALLFAKSNAEAAKEDDDEHAHGHTSAADAPHATSRTGTGPLLKLDPLPHPLCFLLVENQKTRTLQTNEATYWLQRRRRMGFMIIITCNITL